MDETKNKPSHTAHNEENKCFQLLWRFAVIITCIGLSLHLYTLADRYFSYDYDEITETARSIPIFPDVTICSMDGVYSNRYASCFSDTSKT